MARPLVYALRRRQLLVWFDETDLHIGDDIPGEISRGLANSRFGLVVLSRDFFHTPWAMRELDSLLARSSHNKTPILPVWHGVSRQEVDEYSPDLTKRFALRTSEATIDEIAEAIATVVAMRRQYHSSDDAKRANETADLYEGTTTS